jgi:FdhD protein
MHASIRSFCYSDKKVSALSTDLIAEAPLEIIINGSTYSLIMFTPSMVMELVTGFLFTEGLVDRISDIQECEISSPGKGHGEEVVKVSLRIPKQDFKLAGISGGRVSYSSCGICGKENYYDLKRGLKRVKSRHRFSMELLTKLPDKLMSYQPLYQKTGGAHAALLLDDEGKKLLFSEDMGRHNALDKVIGASLMTGTSCKDKILLSSGRASLEMILKTARAGIPIFVAMSRPTSRAVEASKFYNITLVDLAKGSNRIYSHVRRIQEFG